MVFTFDFHPGMFFGGNEKLIYTDQEKEAILKACGVDVLIAYPFTEKTSAMEAEDFIREILVGRLGASFIAVGEDNRFGHKRRGDAGMLLRYSEDFGYGLCACRKVQYGGEAVSSTRIRRTILLGDMEEAGRMLGACFHVVGEVGHGKSLGKTLGFPTLNLVPPAKKLLPPNGVYMTRTTLPAGVFDGITNVGVRPSVGAQENPWVETFLLGYDGECYGEIAKVEFLHFCRPEQNFGSVEMLRQQIARDLDGCYSYFGHR